MADNLEILCNIDFWTASHDDLPSPILDKKVVRSQAGSLTEEQLANEERMVLGWLPDICESNCDYTREKEEYMCFLANRLSSEGYIYQEALGKPWFGFLVQVMAGLKFEMVARTEGGCFLQNQQNIGEIIGGWKMSSWEVIPDSDTPTEKVWDTIVWEKDFMDSTTEIVTAHSWKPYTANAE